MPIPIPSAKYDLTGKQFYQPIGNLDFAPIAHTQKGAYEISLDLFGTDGEGKRVYRVRVTKPRYPTPTVLVDHRFTDLERDAIPEYEALVNDYTHKANAMYAILSGKRRN